MSKLRPTLTPAPSEPGLGYAATYFRVLDATAVARQLIHGRLHDNGNSCAIGCYFRQSSIPIDTQALDEIAAYNDSFPNLSRFERWKKVRKWLKFQVQQLASKKP